MPHPPFNAGAGSSPEERELLRLYRELNGQDKASLRAFAAFLHQRFQEELGGAEPVRHEPRPIPRPEEETVVGAIKRLSESFYMLDRSQMLHETSGLMTEHLLQGRDAMDVIDELEAMFQRHFANYQGQAKDQGRD
ncbi:hypothetical protein [Magnetovirga frankeli]|uniref:hypothetical protein n=1 Tax=Magnetovirga frankeli TaxID=947516 RepID=UPI003D33185D